MNHRNTHLVEEVEWQLKLEQGTHQAMIAVGYTRTRSLQRQLNRLGRNDLAKLFDLPETERYSRKEAA